MDKQKKDYTTIDEYISFFPEDVQVILRDIRQIIKELVPDAQETMSYQIPTFKLNGNPVHFAAFKKHIGFYPAPSGIAAFARELAPYKTSKGTVQFPLDKPVPYDLIKKIVEFKVKENLSK